MKTNTSRDWLKGECPNCGYVPEHFSENNKCRSCGSIYNSGEFDWVLSEITQQEEWKEDSSRDIAGLAELEGRNLSINREVIEDRASYLFWRWIYARVRGTAAPLARDASPEFIAAFPAQKHTLINTAVGAVDLVSVALEGEDAVAKVKVLWSTASEINDEPYHREHLFTLKMPVSLKNPYGLADHSCDTCGAPLPETRRAEVLLLRKRPPGRGERLASGQDRRDRLGAGRERVASSVSRRTIRRASASSPVMQGMRGALPDQLAPVRKNQVPRLCQAQCNVQYFFLTRDGVFLADGAHVLHVFF